MKATTETITTTMATKRITYACEQCDFTTIEKRKADEHVATHAYTEKRVIEGLGTFYRFVTPENFKTFCDALCDFYGTWAGPGWYGYEIEEDWRMGSCVGSLCHLFPAKRFAEQAEEQLASLQRRIAELREIGA